ncbi:MAG: hypothetical protein IJ880_04705 [Bacilli bacterium]|nr:hypothetical protein [Bacilli bacterium]MBR3119722.1 hypothetical protein [Oceanobacillus sp.]
MNTISCEVLTIENDEEMHVGHLNVFTPPSKGEYIWFSEKIKGHSSWIVEDVAHHVGNGKLGSYPMGYQSIVIYAIPTSNA